VQKAASHADPRTTMRYGHGPRWTRYATYIVAAYVAGPPGKKPDTEDSSAWPATGQADTATALNINGTAPVTTSAQAKTHVSRSVSTPGSLAMGS
jgi:hypothetical protein